MSFTRARFPGTWVFGSAIQPAELEHIDDYAYAIDGKDGGTYAPTALLTIGGLGMTVSGPFNATDAKVIDVFTTLSIRGGATLQVLGTQIVTGTVGFASGSFLTVTTGATVTLNAGSTLTAAASSTVNLGGTVTLTNPASITASAARTYTRTIDHPPLYSPSDWLTFTDAESYLPIYSSNTIASGTTEIVWAYRLPKGATVTAVSVWLRPAGGHAGVPTVQIAAAKLLRSANSASNVAVQLDTSATVGDYEAPHELALTGLSITFTEGDLLLIRLTPETGGNALVSLKASAPIVTFTRTTIAEE